MMNKLFLRFFFDTEIKSEKEKIQKKLHDKLIEIYGEATVDEDDETNIETAKDFSFAVKIKCTTWERCFLKIISGAQKLGDEWNLTGRIGYVSHLSSCKPHLTDIYCINIFIDKNE